MRKEVEHGYCVCEKGHLFLKEKPVDGKSHSIDIPLKCSQGRPRALVHTHPSGNINLSEQDKETGRKTGLPICVIVRAGDSRKMRCYKVV